MNVYKVLYQSVVLLVILLSFVDMVIAKAILLNNISNSLLKHV